MACLWMASGFVIYYSVYGMFATHLQKDLHLAAGMVAMPIALANLVAFLASGAGLRRRYLRPQMGLIIPAAIGACITPLYLFSDSYPWWPAPSSSRGRSSVRSMDRIRLI